MTQTTQASLKLCHELQAWCKAQGLPYLRADDLAATGYLTSTQRQWLAGFSTRWNALDDLTHYVYYRINQTGVKKHFQKIVRIEASSVDADWLSMCANENATHPMETLDLCSGELSAYCHVRVHLLKPVADTEWLCISNHWDAANAIIQ